MSQFPGAERRPPRRRPGYDPNDRGASGPSSKSGKRPHWTGTTDLRRHLQPHFGGGGGFLWVDPEAGFALSQRSTDLEFGDWALEAWPRADRTR